MHTKYISYTLFNIKTQAAYTETEHNLSNDKLETCKPYPVPSSFYRLIPTARNSEAVVRPTVTPCDNKKLRIEAKLGFARKA